MTKGSVLVTGGAGYIGAHTLRALDRAGWRPVAFDDLSLGFAEAAKGFELIVGDVRDGAALSRAMEAHGVVAVIHLAGLIEVARSVSRPDLFWDSNVAGTATLLAAMRAHAVPRLVFSSSAAVYGHVDVAAGEKPLTEDLPKNPASPYGDTKLAGERMIAAHCAAFGLTAIALRYFNAAGADPSGELGEAHDPETHLIPLAIDAALGKRGPLTVFGTDFPTPDGTCVRDYIHVSDLAAAHVAALEAPMAAGAFEPLNVGTGSGLVGAGGDRRGGARPRPPRAPRPRPPPRRRSAQPGRRSGSGAWNGSTGGRRSSDLDEIVASAVRWHRAPRYRESSLEP